MTARLITDVGIDFMSNHRLRFAKTRIGRRSERKKLGSFVFSASALPDCRGALLLVYYAQHDWEKYYTTAVCNDGCLQLG